MEQTNPPRYPIPAGRHRVEEAILRSRFITTGMARHFDECVWFDAETSGARTPMPDSVRMAVRDRARKTWQS